MWERVGYRIAAWDTPLRALPNRRAGRFNHAGQGETQYVSLHPLTPWAEVARNERLLIAAELGELRLPIWAIRIVLGDDPARISFDNAHDWGIEPGDLVSDDRSACQRLADRLRHDPDAPKAIVVPSAALPGTENVVIFGARVKMAYLGEPIDELDTPVSLVAERARPPSGLDTLIHAIGSADEHRQLEAWRADESIEFEEPPTGQLITPGPSRPD